MTETILTCPHCLRSLTRTTERPLPLLCWWCGQVIENGTTTTATVFGMQGAASPPVNALPRPLER